jgi:hypothetical protein
MKYEYVEETRPITEDELVRHRAVVVDDDQLAPLTSPATRNGWRAVTLVAGLAGGALLIVLGALGLYRSDVEGSWHTPIVEVNNWPHSPLLSLLEVAAGVAMIIVSLSSVGELLIGAVIAGFGVFALVDPELLDESLSISSAHAWLMVAVGGVAVLSGLIAWIGRRTTATSHADLYHSPTI